MSSHVISTEICASDENKQPVAYKAAVLVLVCIHAVILQQALLLQRYACVLSQKMTSQKYFPHA